MKKHLINLWFDLRYFIGANLATAEERTNFQRIESILWERYRYDIALTKTSFH